MRESTISPSSSYWTFAARRARLFLSAMKVRVRFTRDSRKQLSQLNNMPGSAFLRAMTVKNDLALYIASHEAQNIHFNTDCQEVCYQEGIYFVLHREQGVWFITDVIGSMTPRRTPVFAWGAAQAWMQPDSGARADRLVRTYRPGSSCLALGRERPSLVTVWADQ